MVSAASFKRQIVGNRSKFVILKIAPDTDMNLSMSSATKNTIITVNRTKKLPKTFTLDYCLVYFRLAPTVFTALLYDSLVWVSTRPSNNTSSVFKVGTIVIGYEKTKFMQKNNLIA